MDRWREKGVISRNGRRLLGALASGEPRTIPELVDDVYGDRSDGGPLYADKCIHQLAFHIQKKLGGRVKIEPVRAYVLTLQD